MEKARVKWFLSINRENLPKKVIERNISTYKFKINKEEIEFSEGFTDLHTISYQKIIDGKGYGLLDAKNSIEIVIK